ncbi:hypothetical protein M758_2G066000 [Ceratodon purpureus]|nr:hypothetical protein M758_2G066000 [Ceratodon purpureus]KAG0625580.1 hypothetical protein M758_2G066000 [Ceratodon purpureus]
MADLFVLLRDLGEQIANKGDGTSSRPLDNDAVESRFRSVLPNLLEGYLVPSKVKERELTAILKLLCHTVKNYPGVFYRGKSHAVLPILGRIIPLFAEPELSARHDGLFDTLYSLVVLLKSGEWETYRQLFIGAMFLVEDILSVASFYSSLASFTVCTTTSVQCYIGAYSMIHAVSAENLPALLCDLPSCWTPPHGPGLLVDVTGVMRWQPLAKQTLKLLTRCVSDSALHVEGLLTSSFLTVVGTLLGYGDSYLQKACFDLVRAATAVMDADAIPSKNLILSLLSILPCSNDQLQPFRTASYDASLSACLVALYATSHNGTVECTAQALLDILPQTIKHSLSLELKVALCDIYAMIIKHCPWYSEHLTFLLPLAYIPEIVYHVSYCIELGLATIGTDIGAGRTNSTDDSSGVKPEGSNVIKEELDLPAVDCPESDAGTKELEDARRKRRKLSDNGTARKDENTHLEATKALEPQEDPSVLGGGCRSIDILMSRPLIEQESRCSAGSVYNELLQMMDTIEPKHNAISGDTSVEGKLAALHVLVKVFTKHPVEVCNQRLIQLFHDWVVWILKKSEEQTLGRTQLFMFLEALDCLLARQPVGQSQVTDCSEVVKCNHLEMFCGNSAYESSCVMEILKLPWVSTELSQDEVLKIKAVDLASKLVNFTEGEPYHEIAEHALKDDNSHVQVTAVLALPAFSRHSNSSRFQLYCTGLLSSAQQSSVDIREAVAQILGVMACICNLRNSRIASGDESLQSFDGLICPECDDGDTDLRISIPNHQENGTCETIKPTLLVLWQPLLSKLLEEETSDRVQVAFISSMSRLLRHASAEELISTRTFWLKCLDVLPLHEHRTVREAFCGQVHFFFSEHVLQGLLRSDVKTTSDSDLELDMLGKLRDAFVEAKNSEITQSLLETVAEIAKAAHGRRQLLFFSLVLLLEKLDHEDVSLRVKSISLIHRIASTGFTTASGSTTLSCTQALVDTIRDDLYEHLVRRLVSRPDMVQEFAVAVMRIELEELLKQMVPVILPQLVLVACDQQHSQLALDTLDELVILLKTESLAVLLLEWSHRILSVLLLRADGEQLSAALQFIEAQTGIQPREIFSGILPALLYELVQFLGDVDNDDGLRRSARVVPMMQAVASIVIGSDDIPNFLRPHFVGLLNSIDRKLLRPTDVSGQIKGLRCILHLVDMIGPHLCGFVPKIMALLTQTLQEPFLQEEGLRVWLSFVRTLARVSSTHLKNVTCQIVVSLTPCLEGEPAPHLNAVVEIMEELVIRNRRLLEGQARELPLLPSIPALEKVNSVLHEARGLLSLRDQLKQAMEGLRHESLGVRYMTASELNVVLRSHRKEIAAMMIGEDSLDADVISRLVTALMRGCVEESRTSMSQKLRMACALCLGELGAVDPVKLQVDVRGRSRIERSDEDLVFELITEHLAPVLRAASETAIQDTAAFAIQELLKLHSCQAAIPGRRSAAGTTRISRSAKSSTSINEVGEPTSVTNDCGEKLWQSFPDDVKEIITPCLTSKFLLQQIHPSKGASLAGPLFRSGMPFGRWMYLWIKRLISQASKASGNRADIFAACGGVVRHDMGTALFLLPYLVLNVVCDGSNEARAGVTQEILTVLATDPIQNEEICNSTRNLSRPSEVSTQTVFTLLDNLGQWLDDCKQGGPIMPSLPSASTTPSKGTRGSAKAEAQQESIRHARRLENVSQLLAAIPKQALAGASFRCQAYARALLYFESYVREKSGALNPAAEKSGHFTDEDVTFLLDIYSGLEEPDGLSGISRLRKCSTLQDQILINEKAGNWGEALTCCEQALQMEPSSVTRHLGVLDCLLNMGHLQAMVTHVDGLNSRMPNHKKEWSTKGLQAAWRLGQWDLLEEYVTGAHENSSSIVSEGISSFDISLAKILQALQMRDHDRFTEHLLHCRKTLLAPLAAASMESYSRAYPYVVKLHMLQELEDFSALVTTDAGGINNAGEGQRKHPYMRMEELIEDWESRLKITQPSLWTREPILALRRLVFNESNLQDEVGVCWLQYAKLCREAGHYETASRAILQAQSVGAPNAHMEMAKLLWDIQNCHRAIAELQQALSILPTEVLGEATGAALGGLLVTQSAVPQVASGLPKSSARPPVTTQARRDKELDVAKSLLLLARWVHHTGQKQKKDVLSLYAQVRGLKPQWEKGYFSVAKYYDDLLVDARRRQEENQDGPVDSVSGKGKQKRHVPADDPWWSYLPDALLFYAKGLHKGHRCLFQALPRLLTLWFEFGTHYRGDALATKHVKTVFGRTMSIMRGCFKDLPAYQWLTSLSQLVSRICHQNETLVQLIKQIIIYVLQIYPQQALWTMAAVSKSTVPGRREAAADIIHQARTNVQRDKDKSLFHQFAVLIDQMIKLSFYPGQPKAKIVNIQSEFSALKRMMPVGVIMPLQKALTVSLPADGLSNMKYNPFPSGDYPTISGIEDEVEILASLQRPKKVTLLGSDGTMHPFLCKPKDDLRKDARMMEFTTMINRLLCKDPKSRRRKLYVRTFAVIPLTEDCGMIEWVLHTRGLRHILQDIYVAADKFDRQKTNPLIKRLYDQQGAQGETDWFQNKVLPMFPPVFHRWFLNMFPEPAAWFRARIAYAHTTAVWSMVGHIVGLGDRHGENILFDSTTGDCVHVDFSCLFDKGLSLEKPEVVPFRLTQVRTRYIVRHADVCKWSVCLKQCEALMHSALSNNTCISLIIWLRVSCLFHLQNSAMINL